MKITKQVFRRIIPLILVGTLIFPQTAGLETKAAGPQKRAAEASPNGMKIQIEWGGGLQI